MTSVLVPLGDPAGRDRWTVRHDGHPYLVILHQGALVVTDAECPHKQRVLMEGLVRDGALVCPSHWYAFDLATGRCRNAVEVALKRYPVVDVDGSAFAEVPVVKQLSWAQRLRAHASGEPPLVEQ
jgi:nitrite reductase (NADH) small subunit